MPPIAAAVYARISEDRQGDGLGVARQLDDCHVLAAQRGWPVVGEYIDNDVSAYKGRVRPEYKRLVADIEAGAVDALVVWHLDRLHRQPLELEQFFRVIDRVGGLEMASVSGQHDLATSDGQFHARIMGAVARKESDDKSRRIRRKHLELAQAGKMSGGGTRPFGFEADRLTIREAEAAIIRDLAARFLAGESLHSLHAWLHTSQIATTTGVPWSKVTLRRVLRSGRISGRREHRGEIAADACWPAIISPRDSDQIRAIMDDPHRRSNRRSPRRYLLTGLLRCHSCSEALSARPRQDGVRRYVCASGPGLKACGHTHILSEPVEELIVAATLFRLDTPELQAVINAGTAAADDAIYADISEAQGQLDELATMYGAREISAREWLAARRPVEARLAEARRALRAAGQYNDLSARVNSPSELRSQWPGLALSRQRAIIDTILDHAIIGPGIRGLNKFDASRVTPVWRA
jgi:site-specific DNA recombinase